MKKIIIILFIFTAVCCHSINLQAGAVSDEIKNHVLQTFDFDPELTEIVCRYEMDTLSISDSTDIIVSCREYPIPRGYFPLKVLLQEGSGQIRTLSTSVDILFFEDVLIAKDKIKRNELLSRSDFEFARIEVSKLVGDPVSDLASLDGMRATKTIPEGKILVENMMEPVPVVEKGERVRIVYESGNLKIESYGIAKKDAIEGEMVEVKNTSSGKKVYARAVSDGLVMVER